jgi:hypothetical protein
MEFTVERAKWYRGKGSFGSKLKRSEDGMMCCVGFRCQAAGIPEDAYLDRGTVLSLVLRPDDQRRLTEEERLKLPQGYFEPMVDATLPPASTIGQIYSDNDDQLLSDTQREERLKWEFAKLGDTVIFV